MASSQLYPNEVVINDETPEVGLYPPPGQGRGLQLWRKSPEGYEGTAASFPSDLLIPKSEWQARIKEKEERKNRLSDLSLQFNLPCKDQNGTNFCWINAPTHCVEIIRLLQNQSMVLLSPASAGGPIKGFRNDGGWGKEGLDWIIENGLCPVDKWPPNAISRTYYTDENKALARKYRVTEWFELQPRNMEQQISCLLRNIPVAGGYNWWGHEVTPCDAVWLDGEVAVRQRNSWGMGWGEKGFGILQGSKMYADDQVCPLVTMAS